MISVKPLADDSKETSVDSEEVEKGKEERASSGKAAGHSGRCHAVQQPGETWDQDEFAKFDKKKPGSVMVEYPAGCNVWYNGVPQRWTSKEVLFRIGVDSEEAPCVWIHLTSSRIWRGSNAGNTWTYSGKGSWKPKKGCIGKKAARTKGKVRKRRLAEDNQGSDVLNDELTCTTKATAQLESDEENAIEQCPSPLPVKGSNAVSPDGEAPQQGFQKQQEGEAMLQILADRLAAKEAGDSRDALGSGSLDTKYSQWLYRHHCLLEKQGQLNLAPSGCNLEAGRSDSLLASSNQDGSIRGVKETSSSSGSARQKQDASNNGTSLVRGARQLATRLPKGGKEQAALRSKSKPSSFEAPRSPSPSTPSKPAVGSRRQRSSSADVDPRSTTAGPSLNETYSRQGKQQLDQQAEQSSKPDAAHGTGASPSKGKSLKKGHTNAGPILNRSLSAAAAVSSGKTSKAPAKETRPPTKRAKLESDSKQAQITQPKAGNQQTASASKPQALLASNNSAPSVLTQRDNVLEQERSHAVPHKGIVGFAELVETDIFAKNDGIGCKAC